MKLRHAILLLFLFGIFASVARAQDAVNDTKQALSLDAYGENVSNLYWDSETILPQKPILLSWRVDNATAADVKVQVRWRLLDADGKKILSGGDSYNAGANNYAAGRQLFMPKSRGSYLWIVQAESKIDDSTIKKTSSLPLAVIAKPRDISNPFLSVDTSAEPAMRMADYYHRMGAKIWRSPLITADGTLLLNPSDGTTNDGIERIAVLPAPAGMDINAWLTSVDTLLHSYQVRNWELATPSDVSPSNLLSRPGIPNIINNFARASDRGASISLQGLWPEKSDLPAGMGRFTLQLPVPDPDANSSARRRVIRFARDMAKDMGFGSFALHEGDDIPAATTSLPPRESADALAQNIILAHGAGAQGYSVSLDPAAPPFMDAVNFNSSLETTTQLTPWERAAAYTAASNILGNAQFVKELFVGTPAVYCALFQEGNASVAALWSMQDDEGKLELYYPGASLTDTNGNEVARSDDKGNLTIPLTHDLYYIRVTGSPQVLGEAVRAAAIKGIAPVRVQVLPFTQPVSEDSHNIIRVRLQNITPHPSSGTLTVIPPKKWSVANKEQQFVLQPGQWQIYEFPVADKKQGYDLFMRVRVKVNNGVTGSWTWKGEPAIATAISTPRKSTFTIDGNLDEWKDAAWMDAKNDQFGRKARLALQWDARYLYVAARVQEPRIAVRDDNADAYRFWNSDAIQLGFGWRDQPWMKPTGAPFRDTDYGILLAPFNASPSGIIDGRVLTLWSPTVPFAGTMDHVRWGGAVRGATCSVRYDDKAQETIYEAAIPLTTLGNFSPQTRSNTAPDQPIRFSWIAHTYDGVPVQWGETAGIYPWWGNSGSFLPVRKGFSAAQGLLGFARNDGTNIPAKTPPQPPIKDRPSTPAPPVFNPAPPQNQVPLLPPPVPVQPIPPDLLPPAPPAE